MKYNSQALRNLLCAAFDNDELYLFVHDHFQMVAENFPTTQTKTMRAQALIEYCDRRGCTDELIQAIKGANPAKYAEYQAQLAVEALDQRLQETLKLYIRKHFKDDQFAGLDQAGETDPQRSTLLRQVFVDLELKRRDGLQPSRMNQRALEFGGFLARKPAPSETGQEPVLSAMRCFLNGLWPMLVIIGGPGQGKSTLGQYLAQIHRAILLNNEADEYQSASGDDLQMETFTPKTVRVPFRIILKYFAQWLSDGPPTDSVEAYLAEQIGKGAARADTVSEVHIHDILRVRPALVVLDGLDEVTEPELRNRMLKRVEEFLDRAEVLQLDLQVLATSRPTGYGDLFSPERFLHLELQPMTPDQARVYGRRWSDVKVPAEEERRRVLETLEECLQEEHTRLLLTTPLQVTIVLLIVKDGGRPPAQREALFQEYWTTIFRREKAKAKGVIRTEEQLLFDLHAYLGYLLHRRATAGNVRSLLPEAELRQEVYGFLRGKDRFSSEDAIKQRANQMVVEARNRLVLLVEPEPGLFGFELRSLQEFFAATYLAQTAVDTNQRFDRLKAIARSGHWRNVALFFAGRIMRNFGGEAANILVLCQSIDRDLPDRHLRRGAWLALDIAADGALATNRDLQYGILEYALTVLENQLPRGYRQRLEEALRHLSPDDRRDILCPLLERKVASLPLLCLETGLHVYGQFFGAQPVFVQGLEALLANKRPEYRRSALNLGFRYQANPRWLATQLTSHWPHWFDEDGQSTLWTCWRQAPQFLHTVLSFWSPSEDCTRHILNNLITIWYYLPGDAQVPFSILHTFESLVDQIIVMLECLDILSQEIRGPIQAATDEIASRDKHMGEMVFTNLEALATYTSESDPHFRELLKYPALLPPLRVVLSLFHSQAQNLDTIQFLDLIQATQTWAMNNDILQGFWFEWLQGRSPLLAFALRAYLDGEHAVFQDWKSYLNFSQELIINQQVRTAVHSLAQRVSGEEWAEYMLKLQVGEDIDLPELVSTAEELRIPVGDLVRLSVRYLTGPSKYSSRAIQHVFSILERYLIQPQDIWDKFRPIAHAQWSLDQGTLSKGKQLLIALVDQYPQLSEHNPVIILFLKLLADEDTLQLAPHLLYIIGNRPEIELKVYRGRIIQLLSTVPQKSLVMLTEFTRHTDRQIQSGAFVLWEVLINAIFYGQHSIGIEDWRRLISLRFDWNIGLSLLYTDSARRKQGIALLTLSNFPIAKAEYRMALLAAMAKVRKEDEMDAWVHLLQYIPIVQRVRSAWREALESILAQPRTYPSEILLAAMERYTALVGKAGPEIQGDEAALGLPQVTTRG